MTALTREAIGHEWPSGPARAPDAPWLLGRIRTDGLSLCHPRITTDMCARWRLPRLSQAIKVSPLPLPPTGHWFQNTALKNLLPPGQLPSPFLLPPPFLPFSMVFPPLFPENANLVVFFFRVQTHSAEHTPTTPPLCSISGSAACIRCVIASGVPQEEVDGQYLAAIEASLQPEPSARLTATKALVRKLGVGGGLSQQLFSSLNPNPNPNPHCNPNPNPPPGVGNKGPDRDPPLPRVRPRPQQRPDPAPHPTRSLRLNTRLRRLGFGRSDCTAPNEVRCT